MLGYEARTQAFYIRHTNEFAFTAEFLTAKGSRCAGAFVCAGEGGECEKVYYLPELRTKAVQSGNRLVGRRNVSEL